METIIRNIGNSKGIIIPKYFLDKYNLKNAVEIKEGERGIIIKPLEEKSLLQKKLDALKANKYEVYTEMRSVAESDEAINYYKAQAKEMDDIDLEIMEE